MHTALLTIDQRYNLSHTHKPITCRDGLGDGDERSICNGTCEHESAWLAAVCRRDVLCNEQAAGVVLWCGTQVDIGALQAGWVIRDGAAPQHHTCTHRQSTSRAPPAGSPLLLMAAIAFAKPRPT